MNDKKLALIKDILSIVKDIIVAICGVILGYINAKPKALLANANAVKKFVITITEMDMKILYSILIIVVMVIAIFIYRCIAKHIERKKNERIYKKP